MSFAPKREGHAESKDPLQPPQCRWPLKEFLPLPASRSMDHAEMISKLVLEAVLPGARLEYRVEQSHGEYDFDLRYGGTLAAVEVTESAIQHQKWMSAKISKKEGGSIIAARHCKKSWIVFAMDPKTIPVIRKRLTSAWQKWNRQVLRDLITSMRVERDDNEKQASTRYLLLRCRDVLRMFAVNSRYSLVRLSPKRRPRKCIFVIPSEAARSVRAWRQKPANEKPGRKTTRKNSVLPIQKSVILWSM